MVTVGGGWPSCPSQKLHMPLSHRSQLPQKFYWWFFQTVPGREWGCMWGLGVLAEDLCLTSSSHEYLLVCSGHGFFLVSRTGPSCS